MPALFQFIPIVTGSLIGMYHICHRKLWLHANQIRMEHNSELVAKGKQLHEDAERYREILLDGSKIVFYDPYDKVVHEIKKSDKLEHSLAVRRFVKNPSEILAKFTDIESGKNNQRPELLKAIHSPKPTTPNLSLLNWIG
jgi:hypothetical protein